MYTKVRYRYLIMIKIQCSDFNTAQFKKKNKKKHEALNSDLRPKDSTFLAFTYSRRTLTTSRHYICLMWVLGLTLGAVAARIEDKK